ncbi:hypothetical protein GY664_04945 [Candidatus Liberibacter brunswickensis]
MACLFVCVQILVTAITSTVLSYPILMSFSEKEGAPWPQRLTNFYELATVACLAEPKNKCKISSQ